jgi:uncharacterized protein (DUF488 family)
MVIQKGVPSLLRTVGHGTLSEEKLAELLVDSGTRSLVDIRTAPGSRRLPHVRREEMARWLPCYGVDYRWEPALGGFRKPAPDSPNTKLRNVSFRGYADYMQADPFWAALDGVLLEARQRQVAVMCSESVWWRCHRRLVADAAVLVRKVPVEHLMHGGEAAAHVVTEGARPTADGRVLYDGGEARLHSG